MRTQAIWLFALAFLLGCATASSPAPGPKEDPGAANAAQSFELNGSWDYVGSVEGLRNKLVITNDKMMDSGDYKGTGWIIAFTIKSWNNEAKRALLEVAQIEGFSHYPLGAPLYLSWRFADKKLILYIGKTDYLEPSGGTEGKEFVTYARL